MYKSKSAAFEEAMYLIYDRAESECRYLATYFLQMVRDKGAIATAKYLVNTEQEQMGFVTLSKMKRLDLTVEFLVIQKEWKELFTKGEQINAMRRLIKYGYKPPVK
jgi:hypothetical protein